MDTALKKMFSRRQTRDLQLAALKHSGPGYRDLAKATGTFGNGVLPWPIELRNETAAEVFEIGKGMGLAALINHAESSSLLDVDCVRFEIPVRVRMSRFCL